MSSFGRVSDVWSQPTPPPAPRPPGQAAATVSKFCFIIPSFNNVETVKHQLGKIVTQTYSDWRVIYVDDQSTDGTVDAAKDYLRDQPADIRTKFQFLRNESRKYQAFSRWTAYRMVPDDEILVLLDGDDFLASDTVLEKLHLLYLDGAEMTYGQARFWRDGCYLPRLRFIQDLSDAIEASKDDARVMVTTANQNVHKSSDLTPYFKYFARGLPWSFGHLRTFRARHLKTMPESMIRNPEDPTKYLDVITDCVETFYVVDQLERAQFGNAPHRQIRNAHIVTCIYNQTNSAKYDNSSWHSMKAQRRRQRIHYQVVQNVSDAYIGDPEFLGRAMNESWKVLQIRVEPGTVVEKVQAAVANPQKCFPAAPMRHLDVIYLWSIDADMRATMEQLYSGDDGGGHPDEGPVVVVLTNRLSPLMHFTYEATL